MWPTSYAFGDLALCRSTWLTIRSRAACPHQRYRRTAWPFGRRYSSATKAAAQVRLICTYFRARPIAPYRERRVSARTTSAPQLRFGGGISSLPALAWTQSNSRWTMSGGYIDERRHVKKIAVCHCDFLKVPNPIPEGRRRCGWECRVEFMLVLIAFVCCKAGSNCHLTSLHLLRGMRKSKGVMRSARGNVPLFSA
jgi:hypothetical protein